MAEEAKILRHNFESINVGKKTKFIGLESYKQIEMLLVGIQNSWYGKSLPEELILMLSTNIFRV